MAEFVRYLTHPQVRIDPSVSVPEWGLSKVGRERAQVFALHPGLVRTKRIVSSGERKAIDTAEIVAGVLGVEIEVRENMHENDRTATGYLPAPAFERTADQFFAHPNESVDGWERAIDAQTRIVHELESVLARDGKGDVLVIGHGGVGTLLLCHYSRVGIDRRYDQPEGGGHYFTLEQPGRRVMHAWRRMEDWSDD